MAGNSNNRFRGLPGITDPDLLYEKDQLIEEFETLIRRYKRRGIAHPIQVIDDHIGIKSLDDAKVFGLMAGSIFTFVSVPALYTLKAYCLLKGVPIDLPEEAIINFAMINGGCVMTFGFGSAINSAIAKLKAPPNEITFIPEEDDES